MLLPTFFSESPMAGGSHTGFFFQAMLAERSRADARDVGELKLVGAHAPRQWQTGVGLSLPNPSLPRAFPTPGRSRVAFHEKVKRTGFSRACFHSAKFLQKHNLEKRIRAHAISNAHFEYCRRYLTSTGVHTSLPVREALATWSTYRLPPGVRLAMLYRK